MSKEQREQELAEYKALKLQQRITEIAKNRGLSINKLEEKSGINKSTIKNWINSEPGVMKVLKVANELEVDLRYLVTGEPPRRNISSEQEKILDIYEELTPRHQAIIKGKLYETLMEQSKREENENQKVFEIAKKMLMKNMSVADVMTYTDLNESTVKQLQEELTK